MILSVKNERGCIMTQEEIIKRLREPFTFKEVEWKIQVTTQDKAKGMAVAYIDSRAIQKRLDEVVGAFNWQNSYSAWQDKSQICGLSLFSGERGDWVTKFDGAENTDIEPIKGGLSDAFKRVAIQWGIGRYLYELTGLWVEIEQRGKSSVIKNNQYAYLEAEYNKAVAKIFGGVANKATAPSAGGDKAALHSDKKTTAKAPTTAANNKQDAAGDNPDYWVQSVKPSGKESQLLELVNADGDVVSAYVKSSDKGIKVGAMLQNVNMVRKDSSYGPYNLIDGYKIAA